MNYYLLFEKFENSEGSFTVQEQWDYVLDFDTSQKQLFKNRPYVSVDECYTERGMSDFLKVGVGMLASKQIQQIFFDYGFTGIQFSPVEVENSGLHLSFAFMNATAHYDFLDPIASKASSFNQKLGIYADVYEVLIDQEKFISTDILHDCFTLSNYKNRYYVNEQVKNALENAGVTGMEFIPMEFA